MFKDILNKAVKDINTNPALNPYMVCSNPHLLNITTDMNVDHDEQQLNVGTDTEFNNSNNSKEEGINSNDVLSYRSKIFHETLSVTTHFTITNLFAEDYKELTKFNEQAYQEKYVSLILDLLHLSSCIRHSLLYNSIVEGRTLTQNEIALLWAIEGSVKSLPHAEFVVKQRKDEWLLCSELPNVVALMLAIAIKHPNLNEKHDIRKKVFKHLPQLIPYFQ